MDCPRIQENLSAWLDGEMPAAEAEALRRHVESCAACRQMAEELRSVSTLLKGARRQAAPAGLADEVQSRLEREMLMSPAAEEPEIIARMDRRLAHEQRAWWPRVAAVAACVALVAAIAALWPAEKSGVATKDITKTDLAMTLPGRDAPAPARPAEAEKKAENFNYLGKAGRRMDDTKLQEERTAAEAPAPSARLEAKSADEYKTTEEYKTMARKLLAENAPQQAVVAAGPAAKPTLSAGQALPENGILTQSADGAHAYVMASVSGNPAGLGENRLILAADSDLTAAAREMNEVLAQAGIHTLTQQQAAGEKDRDGLERSRTAKAAKAEHAAKSAHGSVAPPVATLVYTGTLSNDQLSNLNSQVAQNGKFTVAARSNGAFAQMPMEQNSFRLNNSLRYQNIAQVNNKAGNVPSGGQAKFGYYSNVASVPGATPAAPGQVGGGAGGVLNISGQAPVSGLDKLKEQSQTQVPVVIEVQARGEQTP